MKKIVALVLSLVMALALCTTAFADVPLWTLANANTTFDSYTYDNRIDKTGLSLSYVAAKAPVYGADGKCTTPGTIAFYYIAQNGQNIAAAVPVDKWVDGCWALKVSGAEVAATINQTAPEAVYYMLPISAAKYVVSGEKFADWGTKCGQYADPKDDNTYVKFDYAKAEWVQALSKADATDADPYQNVLVDGKVVTMLPTFASKYEHNWVAEKLNTKTGKVEAYKCSRCGVVATVVDSSFNAPKDATLVELTDGTLIYFYENGKAADKGTSSPKTFDAGIAMYVGLSLMSVAGSAVVIGKKKEF